MTRKIFQSIFGACLLVLSLAVLISVRIMYRGFVDEQIGNLDSETARVASVLNRSDVQEQIDLLDEDFELFNQGDLRLCLIDPDGEVVYDSLNIAHESNHKDREEIAEARESGKGFSIRHSSTSNTETYNAAMRLANGRILRLSQTHSSLIMLFGQMVMPVLILIPLLLLLSYILARLLSRHIVTPINAIDPAKPLENIPYEQLRPLLERLDENNRQIAEQIDALEESQMEFDALSDSMDEGLIMVWKTGRATLINQAAREIFALPMQGKKTKAGNVAYAAAQNLDPLNDQYTQAGEQTAEGKAKPKGRLKTEDGIDLYGHSRQLRQLIQCALAGESLKELRHKKGKIYSLEAQPIWKNQEVIGAMVLALDITDRQQAAMRRQEFTANVTHELKTPLQTISSSAELLASGMVRKEDESRFLGYILKESRRMTEMVSDIITLSRLENERKEGNPKSDLYGAAKEISENLKSAADLKSMTIECTGASVDVCATRTDLERILKNLMENAIRYGFENGHIQVCVSVLDANTALVEVADDGPGIDESLQDRIFERFFTADPSRSKTGTGLGLAIVKHTLEKLSGTIRLDSQPGKGSRFFVEIPRWKPEDDILY